MNDQSVLLRPWEVVQLRRVGLFCGAFALGFFAACWSAHLSMATMPALADDGVHCHVHRPAVVGDWSTALAECDGLPVAIGALPKDRVGEIASSAAKLAPDSAEYAQDMQAIRGVLSSGPTPTPKWVSVAAALLGLAFLGGVVRLIRALLRAAPRIKMPPQTVSLPVVGPNRP